MSFLAEMTRPACWIILYLHYLISFSDTVNEGGPELPCMARIIIIVIIIIINIIIIIIVIIIIIL